jgi:hypothetical protein
MLAYIGSHGFLYFELTEAQPCDLEFGTGRHLNQSKVLMACQPWPPQISAVHVSFLPASITYRFGKLVARFRADTIRN